MDTQERVARQRSFFTKQRTPGLLVFISEDPSRSDRPPYTGLMARVNQCVEAHCGRLPDEEQIERCNELVSQMPETNQQEINRSINTFLECLED